jgi:hypothetical protein
MYKIEMSVILQARDGTMGLSRWLSLPFPPVAGMGLYGITTEPNRAEEVAFIAWDIINECFYVELLDCQSLEESLSELIDYYGPEWELHEPGFEQR